MFKLIKIENSRMNVPEPIVYEVADGEAVSAGEALVLSNGKLTKATATPAFIALSAKSADADDRQLYVSRITSDHLYEVAITAAPTSLKVGDKVTLSDDGLGVTATTDDGCAEIVSLEEASDIGDKIIVRF